MASFRKAFELDPQRVGAANNAAWVLSAHPDPRVRDGEVALQLATRINTQTKRTNHSLLDTLAEAPDILTCA